MLILIADAFDKSLPEKLSVYGEVTSDMNRLAEADVVLIRSKTKATKEYIDSAKNMKLIIRGGVGMDNIDREYCKEKGIIAVNTPKSSAIAVAELAFALMISVPNHIPYFDNTMKNGEWMKKVKRTELNGKTLALLGLGHIAREVAARAKAFGMHVQAYDKYVTQSDLATLKATPEEAVKDADYISMHLPLTDETAGMMNAALIAKMEHHPVLINTGRGKCVNEQEVADALSSGGLDWFCTDVYSTEPPTSDNPILKAEHVTLTPHVGAGTVENLLRIGNEVFDTIAQYKKEGKI